ncbi:hypothetical protein ABZ949_33755 [Micromonospora tulbaghiae]|uniref:hypothetical protein n=1 Tax=Micromonospora tulbaghiae TaxID=479978 RepID=UPI0033D5059D
MDTAFADLTCDPDPLSLDLDTLAGQLGDDSGLPGGVIALPALRQWLLEHPRAYRVRDVVWQELIRRARLDGPAWAITAVALAPPALRRYAGRLHTGWASDAHDLDAEILTAFLTALRDRVNLGPPGAVHGADAGGGLTAGRPAGGPGARPTFWSGRRPRTTNRHFPPATTGPPPVREGRRAHCRIASREPHRPDSDAHRTTLGGCGTPAPTPTAVRPEAT